MSEDFSGDTETWCDKHTLNREACGCPFGSPPSRLERILLDRAALATLPEPRPLITNTLDQRTTAVLAGHFGTGKSFLALDWAACIATGKSWQGREVVPGQVLFVAAEGAHGLHKRLDAWEYAWQHTISPKQFQVIPEPVNLTNTGQMLDLLGLVERMQPRLVVFDTLARCSVGVDENSAKEMGVVVDMLDRVKRATDGGVALAIHHTGKDRRTVRGSSAVEDGVDTVYMSEGDSGLLKIERTKRKDGPTPDRHQMKLQAVEAKDSVVIVSTRGVDMRPAAQHILSTFLSSFSATGASKSELKQAAELSTGSFYRGLNSLIEEGLLVNEGSDRSPRYRLGATDE